MYGSFIWPFQVILWHYLLDYVLYKNKKFKFVVYAYFGYIEENVTYKDMKYVRRELFVLKILENVPQFTCLMLNIVFVG